MADGRTEVSVLLPDRQYPGWWHRILHDRTAEAIAEQVSRLAHANVTRVPYHLGSTPRLRDQRTLANSPAPQHHASTWTPPAPDSTSGTVNFVPRAGCTPIGSVRWRERVRIAGTVRS